MKAFECTASRVVLSIFAGMLIAGASLFTADVALSASELLPGLTAKPRSAVKPLEVLPPPTGDTRPVRQTSIGNCSIAAAPGWCRFAFTVVGPNRLLEITNVTCSMSAQEGNNTWQLLTTSPTFDLEIIEKLIAIIPGTRALGNVVISNVSGPYYFKAGERPYIWGASLPDAGAVCTISGNLSRTD
jgi:hypothetical protein